MLYSINLGVQTALSYGSILPDNCEVQVIIYMQNEAQQLALSTLN